VGAIPLILFSTYLSMMLLVLLLEPDLDICCVLDWRTNLRNIFVSHIMETFALVWLLPDIQKARKSKLLVPESEPEDAPDRQPDADETDIGETVLLAGQRFPLQTLRRVSAAEHHLNLHFHDGAEIKVRERMGTFLQQVKQGHGIQTHRSHWLSKSDFLNLEGGVVVTRSGSEIPVARGRISEVINWINTL
jgi:hypothetical protein